MTAFYDEVEIEDFTFDEDQKIFFFPCPCGDKFQITLEDILDGEEVARCPSCSLIVRVIYDPEDFGGDEEDEEVKALEERVQAIECFGCFGPDLNTKRYRAKQLNLGSR